MPKVGAETQIVTEKRTPIVPGDRAVMTHGDRGKKASGFARLIAFGLGESRKMLGDSVRFSFFGKLNASEL